MADRVWLIGMMGSGKTAVGQIVAARLGVPFIDTDAAIVARLGSPMTDLWAEWGEAGFRRIEAEEVVKAAMAPPGVIATGGGVVLSQENVTLMRRAGTVVWLEAPARVLAERVSHHVDRPLLEGGGPPLEDRLETILAERESLYRAAAHHRVTTDNCDPEAVARSVIKLIEA